MTVLAMFGALVPFADASRAPTSKERAAIKRVALKACEGGGARARAASTRPASPTKNARYAWADVTTEGFSGALLKRANTRTRRFKVVGTQGGGIGDCAEWRKLAPARGAEGPAHLRAQGQARARPAAAVRVAAWKSALEPGAGSPTRVRSGRGI